ncbi:MAG TPA: putative Ig domain-containing protein [Cytophagaceae bacterium]
MKRNILLGMLSLMLINFLHAQIPDSCTFVQTDSIITIEMESANLNGGFWIYQNDKPGYTGNGFIQYVGGDATGVPGKSQLTYTFRVKEAGRHSFKMRAFRDDYHDNDVWVRFPHGGVVTKIDNDSTGSLGSEWFKAMIGARDTWYGFVKTQLHGTSWGETLHDIYVDFPEPGVYTVQFSGRASMFRIDRFMLYYKKSSFFGMDPANPESPRENCEPYNMEGKLFVANPIPDISIKGNETWTFTVPDSTFGGSTSIGYSSYLGNMFPLPSWITFDSKTKTFTANPIYENGGQYTIIVKGENNGSHAVDAFYLTVSGNNPPVMLTPLKDTIVNAGEDFVYDFGSNFFDEDGHVLTYQLTSQEGSLPSWLSLSGTTLTGSPSLEDVGIDTIYITVDDGFGGSITEGFRIEVKPVVIQGVNSFKGRMDLSIYPNPVDDIINITSEYKGTGSIYIIGQLGKVYARMENIALGSATSLDISSVGLQPGLYLIRVKSDESTLEYNGLLIKK